MTEPNLTQPTTLHGVAPSIAPPPAFVERRRRSRRAADRLADEETRLLALALDVLASDRPAEARLAGLLDLLADTVGAHRAAVVADGDARRVAVAASGSDDIAPAIELAAWLDAESPRSRARRAAAAPAEILVATRAVDPERDRRRATPDVPHYGCVPISGNSDVSLGFVFAKAADAAKVADRLPATLGRHAAVALALVTEAMTTERELAALRAGKAERDRYVAAVAHELRTPLTGLAGYLDLILDGHVDDEAVEREFLERSRSIVGSMSSLVGDLLELSRLESGSLVLDSTPFSVAEALHTVESALLPIALDRGVTLATTPPARIRTATGDRRRVEQIITNLAANAIKYGAEGREVEITGRFDGPLAVMAVRDEGPGIGADDRSRIFDRFYRMADHERVTGTGLGLSISRDLARAMGGDLDVTSVLGVGSTFVLVLPGPGAPAESAALVVAIASALREETERLEALAIVRAAASAGVPPSERAATEKERPTPAIAIRG